MAEVGVYRGEFAARVLAECDSIETYYMIDPWRHLDDWNKPANTDDRSFEEHFDEAMRSTEFAADKRIVLRGTTTEVIDRIPDASLDFVYIDGDHTLRGITIDLIRVFPKIRDGGRIGGDDFTPTMFQHSTRYEPTMVFPTAVHFAEAVGAPIYALPHDQFLIERNNGDAFRFHDLTGRYGDIELRRQFRPRRLLWTQFVDWFPLARRAMGKAKQFFSRRP